MAQKLDVTAYMKSAHWLKQYEIEAKKDGIHNKKTGELLVSFPFEIDPATAVLPSAPSSEGKDSGKAAGDGKQETGGKAAGQTEGQAGKEEQGGKPTPPKAGSEGTEGRGSEELSQPPSPPQPQQPPRSGEETSSP